MGIPAPALRVGRSTYRVGPIVPYRISIAGPYQILPSRLDSRNPPGRTRFRSASQTYRQQLPQARVALYALAPKLSLAPCCATALHEAARLRIALRVSSEHHQQERKEAEHDPDT